jgi:hypothetical protein
MAVKKLQTASQTPGSPIPAQVLVSIAGFRVTGFEAVSFQQVSGSVPLFYETDASEAADEGVGRGSGDPPHEVSGQFIHSSDASLNAAFHTARVYRARNT